MSQSNQKKEENGRSQKTNKHTSGQTETNFHGPVYGQIHTGSGDNIISSNVEPIPKRSASRNDTFTYLENGLQHLMAQVTRTHAQYAEALVYQHRLQENINSARRFGDTPTRQAERAEVIDQLNGLALSVLNVSFNVLCQR